MISSLPLMGWYTGSKSCSGSTPSLLFAAFRLADSGLTDDQMALLRVLPAEEPALVHDDQTVLCHTNLQTPGRAHVDIVFCRSLLRGHRAGIARPH